MFVLFFSCAAVDCGGFPLFNFFFRSKKKMQVVLDTSSFLRAGGHRIYIVVCCCIFTYLTSPHLLKIRVCARCQQFVNFPKRRNDRTDANLSTYQRSTDGNIEMESLSLLFVDVIWILWLCLSNDVTTGSAQFSSN